MHDHRIARLAGEFLDPDVDAVDDGAFGQVGIAVGVPQVAYQGCTVLRYVFIARERAGRCRPGPFGVVSRCEQVITGVPPP